MSNDSLAMRWKAPTRVAERIVERGVAQSSNGAAFR